MGSKGFNGRLGSWIEEHYASSKFDLMTCFMERSLAFLMKGGFFGMINIPSWMFLTSYEALRLRLLKSSRFVSLVHLGRGVFGSDFGTVTFVIQNSRECLQKDGFYRRLFQEHVEVRKPEVIEALFRDRTYGSFKISQLEFLKIPGTPIAYWVSVRLRGTFARSKLFEEVAQPRKGITTSDNERFLRSWHEIGLNSFAIGSSRATESVGSKWFPLNKGGNFRRWYGNKEIVIDWNDHGREIKGFDRAVIRNESFYFREGMTWNDITSGIFAMRYSDSSAMFEGKGPMAFTENKCQLYSFISFFNSSVCAKFLAFLAPTINFNIGDVARVPIIPEVRQLDKARCNGERCIDLSRQDWDTYETSWDFTALPLLDPVYRRELLAGTYAHLRVHWRNMQEAMQQLEEENNRIFIEAYGLQDELTPEVPLDEITLTCNPAYRYGGKKTEAELEALLLADTMRELLSYAVGCMFGRYSLDAPGLILANQGEGIEEYLAKAPTPTFEPDSDNVIPMLDGDWFADDIAARFRKFLRVTFGEERFAENLAFIEAALGKDIRKYFTRDFFNDHVKRYKKRPIYWLFSSPKGTFNALIYMHRYRPDTVSVVLNDYLREFRSKLEAHRRALEALSNSAEASITQKAKALKEISAVGKQIEELDAYERDVLFPLATQKIAIDLDDGVKANYPKFGAALKPIKGLNDAED